MRLPISPWVNASTAAKSGIRKGSENRLSSLICGDQLMVEPIAMSITPWRIAENSRVWSPCTSDTPGYIFTLMRPLVFSLTRLAQISPPLPHGKALPTTVESLYSALYCDWPVTMAGNASAAPVAAAPWMKCLRFMLCLPSIVREATSKPSPSGERAGVRVERATRY